MKCPKCNIDITEDMLICPNCKKVLKLVCPKCKTINKANSCRKCGFVIISKCHKCGKINQTINDTCSKCGFSTHTSVAINSSNIDEFACLTVEFPNIGEIKSVLGSTKLFDKFKVNLDRLIFNYTNSIGLTREIIKNIYIIRVNKDDSFSASAKTAMKAAIEIQNLVTELNFKLNKLKNASLRCNIAVLKRDIYSKPDEYKSGFDIKLIYQNKSDLKLLNNLQIVTDQSIYEELCDEFNLKSLNASFVKNQMVMFFELTLKKYIKIPKKEDDEDESKKGLDALNILGANLSENYEDENNIYNIESINFNELKCNFSKTKSVNLIPEVLKKLKQNKKNIISVKCEKEFFPKTGEILNSLEDSNLFKNIFRVTCHDEMKHKPYGFFYELISSIYNFSQCTKNIPKNNFEMFKGIDPSDFIKSLINLSKRSFPHPEDVRYSLFDIFFNIFHSMSNSLIYIESFEKIDDTSYEVLQLLFEKFGDFDINYLILADKDFSLHKHSHFLLSNPNYSEITVKPTPFKEIIEKDIKKFKDILDSYYMQKISQNTKGSPLYFSQVIDYLKECEVLLFDNGAFTLTNCENIFVPTKLDELISKRLKHLSKDKDAYKMFGMLLLIGPMIDLQTLILLQIPNGPQAMQKLAEKNYIYIYNNTIYIQNYNLFRETFLSDTSLELKQALAKELLEKAFSTEVKHPVETVLYKILDQEKQEFITWEKLAKMNASMGDFSAYLNCSVKFLKLIDNHINEDSEKSIEEYKMEVYENISNLLYKYTPGKIYSIAQTVLKNLEKTTDDKKTIDFCNKMIQGCLLSGNYSYALELLHKILSRFPDFSRNPESRNFNMAFFLISLIKIEVLFSVGNLKDCLESGDEILEVLTKENIEKLKPEHLSKKQFNDIIIDAMCFTAISRIILFKNDLEEFLTKVQELFGEQQIFEILLILQRAIKGLKVELPQNIDEEDNKFTKIIVNLIKAFNDYKDDYKQFASSIYQAKISAKMHKLLQFELICDLLIGYSYFKLGQEAKASSIYYNVLEISNKNGLKIVTHIDWYLISMLKFKQNDINMAFGIANNAIIQLEKDSNSSDFLFFLFRILLSKILLAKGNTDSAELCLKNAKFIQKKYGLNFEINTDLTDTEEKASIAEEKSKD